MNVNTLSGLLIILLAGTCSGIFSLPFKSNRNWKWENNWFIWSFSALIVMPWLAALLTVSHLGSIYAAEPTSTGLVLLFGLIWGFGAILFGKGIDFLGISLSLPIMQGLINTTGTLIPILLRDPSELLSANGAKTIGGIVLLLIGIILFAIAGNRKAGLQGAQEEKTSQKRFRTGMLICILAGIFGPMINFALIYGQPLQDRAVAAGVAPFFAANIVWCLALTAGFVINALECGRLFRKNGSWKNYKTRPGKGLLMAGAAGLIWFLSIMLYGMGGSKMGVAGTSIGWAVMQSVAILAGNFAGIFSGEWRNTTRHARRPMITGLVFLLLGIVLLASAM